MTSPRTAPAPWGITKQKGPAGTSSNRPLTRSAGRVDSTGRCREHLRLVLGEAVQDVLEFVDLESDASHCVEDRLVVLCASYDRWSVVVWLMGPRVFGDVLLLFSPVHERDAVAPRTDEPVRFKTSWTADSRRSEAYPSSVAGYRYISSSARAWKPFSRLLVP